MTSKNQPITPARPANFFAACLPSLATHIYTTMKRYPGFLTRDEVNRFLKATVNKHLSSIGIAFYDARFGPAPHIDRKYKAKYVEVLKEIHQRICLDGCEVAIDCGGFDLIQQGHLPFRLFRDYIMLYHEFLEEHSGLFNSAFHLDIAPGYKRNPFPSEKDMSIYNYISYKTTAQLPPVLHERMMYIHHFRTPAILRVWRQMLFNDRLADKFWMFATGGLATSPEMPQLGTVAYALPMVDIIHYVKAFRPDLRSFRFHVLGDAGWKDLLAHAVLEEHVRTVHDLDISITCDSSNVYRTIGKGRYTNICGDTIEQISIASENLLKDHMGQGTQQEIFYKDVNTTLEPYGFPPLSPEKNPIYESGTMTPLAYTYTFLHRFAKIKEVEDNCRSLAANLYPVYGSGDLQEFERQVTDELRKLHDGKTDKNIPDYAQRIVNAMQLIERLDLNEVANLVARLPEEKEFSR